MAEKDVAVPKRSMAKVQMQCMSDIHEGSLTEIFKAYLADPNVKVELVDSAGKLGGVNDNYNSDIKKVHVRVTAGDGSQRDVHMIVKMHVDTSLHRTISKIGRPFLREVIWYSSVAPALARSEVAGLSPRCYHSWTAYDKDWSLTTCERLCYMPCWLPFRKSDRGLMLLEDLTQPYEGKPFAIIDKNKVLDVAHVKLALRSLGHYHGVWWRFLNGHHESGITLQESQEIYSENMPKALVKSMVKNTFKSLEQLLRNHGEHEEALRKVRHYGSSKAADVMVKAMGGPDASGLMTIAHGDFWSNNMLFSHNEDGSPDAVKFIDFQMMARSHPARDICYFLYVNTDRAFREQHLDEVLREYFESFSHHLKESKKEISYEDFRREFDQRREYGLIFGMIVAPNVLSPNQRKLESFADFRAMDRHRHEDIAGPNSEQTHPMIKEIRRRAVDMYKEFAELNVF